MQLAAASLPGDGFRTQHDAIKWRLTEDLHDGWEVAEELALLEGLRLYGIGNWDDISTHIGTRNSSTCKQRTQD